MHLNKEPTVTGPVCSTPATFVPRLETDYPGILQRFTLALEANAGIISKTKLRPLPYIPFKLIIHLLKSQSTILQYELLIPSLNKPPMNKVTEVQPLVLASTVILGSESQGTHEYILLSGDTGSLPTRFGGTHTEV
jgi:hypothetical protein